MASPEVAVEAVTPAQTARTRSTRGNILFAFAILLALMVAYVMREILLLLYVSALFAVVLSPVIRGIMQLRIKKWHPGKGLAILLLLLSVGGAATLFFIFAMPPVVRDVQSLVSELPTRGPQLLDRLHRLPLAAHFNFAGLNTKVQGFVSNFAEYLFLSISGLAGQVADIGMVIFLTIYFMLDGEEAYHWMLSFFPITIRERLDKTLLRADARMGKWLVGQGSLMLLIGLCSLIVFILLKVRYAYALAVLMGVLNIIPIVGGHDLHGAGGAGRGYRFVGEGFGRADFLCDLCPGRDFVSDSPHHEEQRGPFGAGGSGCVAGGLEAGRGGGSHDCRAHRRAGGRAGGRVLD